MIVVKSLVWDYWNREHIAAHTVTIEEVEEVCHRRHTVINSYRNRILLKGKTKKGRRLAVVLSPEDRKRNFYGEGIYYVYYKNSGLHLIF